MIKEHTLQHFQRFEVKYLITRRDAEELIHFMKNGVGAMLPDPHGDSTVCSLYFDTPDKLLIRRSISRPVFKEKLRLRTYISNSAASPVFTEIKRKYSSVVSKRRIELTEADALCLIGGRRQPVGQIEKEIAYFSRLYSPLSPSVYMSYHRSALVSEDGDLRITFDDDLRCRMTDLSIEAPPFGKSLLDSEKVLMEIKTPHAIPLWLTEELSRRKIYSTSFSKYGTAYKTFAENKGAYTNVTSTSLSFV